MMDPEKSSDGPTVDSPSGWDYTTLPQWDNDFYVEEDILDFASALSAPDVISPAEEDLLNPKRPSVEFITALNDWRPVHQSVRNKEDKKAKRRKKPRRGKDEHREGYTYGLVKYPLLLFVLGWLLFLSVGYLLTRFYIFMYERYVTWRGKRNRLRKSLRQQKSYQDWVEGAKELDNHLGNEEWKRDPEYAYWDYSTIQRIMARMKRLRSQAERQEMGRQNDAGGQRPMDALVELVEGCVKHNFAGFENSRLYSETYYGTKDLLQNYVDEVSKSLSFIFSSSQLSTQDKHTISKHLSTKFGRTALCLSGGAVRSLISCRNVILHTRPFIPIPHVSLDDCSTC